MLDKKLMKMIASDISLKTTLNDLRNKMIEQGINKDIAQEKLELIIAANLPTIESYLNKHIICDDSPMINCKQKDSGFEDSIFYENGQFYLAIKKCANWNHDHKNESMKKQFVFIDYDLDQFSQTPVEYLKQLEQDKDIFSQSEINDRKSFLQEAASRISGRGPTRKGIYLFGLPGVGKTTLMKVIANGIAAKQQKKVGFVAVPNLINTIKESFSNQFARSPIVNSLKKVDVLFLDDIGGENASNWSRDDLLFTILNYRMENNKITFFTSNFSWGELAATYKVDANQQNIELVKQKRFMERIKALADTYELAGKSHR